MFRRLLPTIVAAVALALVASTAVLAVTIAKSGKAVTAVRTVVETTLATTESSTFVDIPGMSTTINVPASQRALLIITFSAEVTCQPEGVVEGSCLISVLVDGAPSTPAHVIFDGSHDNDAGVHSDQSESEANSMQFVAGPLSSGPHEVKVQWMTDAGTGDIEFRMQERTLTVLRAKV